MIKIKNKVIICLLAALMSLMAGLAVFFAAPQRAAAAIDGQPSAYLIYFRGSENANTLPYTVKTYGVREDGTEFAEDFRNEPSGTNFTPGGFNFLTDSGSILTIQQGMVNVVTVTEPLYAGDTIQIIWMNTSDGDSGPNLGKYVLTGPSTKEVVDYGV